MRSVVAPTVKRYVEQSVAPLVARIAELEARPVPKEVAGLSTAQINRDGCLILTLTDGTSKDLGRVEGRDGSDGHPGDRGEKGRDGKDADPNDIAATVMGSVGLRIDEALSNIPVPENGKDGAPGGPGKDGIDGKDGRDGKSITLEDVQPLIDGAVAKAVAAIHVPSDGRDGRDADPDEIAAFVKGAVEYAVSMLPKAKDGRDGIDGKDGVSTAGALIDRGGNLVLTLSDGTTRELGLVVGRDGKNGTDGKDGLPGKDGSAGLSIEDLSAEFDGERTLTLRFARGDVAKEFQFSMPIPIDRGVYRPEMAYVKGDGVSYGGSFWIAQKDIPKGKPDEGTGDWRLSTKRGRDGKDGLRGAKGEPGPKGKDGRDLTQLGSDGSKWS